ncbi:puff-specific protein Bx42 [Drosophila persimilis]|uniref:Puff-specific protein Bx42 n=1 Tax=Drosophila pseudoobscura pseudoobscura TaxID=46245 RepID=Q29GX2_DROPS|nr:puff-specific protein Bx42 [Drosophila pseudoobscura]XP_026846393.1 puff-specific protein Bx42 [Drosophila persimilis]
MSLSSLLPTPTNAVWDREDERRLAAKGAPQIGALVSAKIAAPPYGCRKDWVPRTEADFGDGGAFPEIHVAQYPLGLGAPGTMGKKSDALAVRLDDKGKIKYDAIARQGHGKDKVVYSSISQLLPAEVLAEDADELQRPDEESVAETTEETRLALEKLTNQKITSALPVRHAQKAGPAQYIRYTPSQQGDAFNSGAKQRVIRMVEAQLDPMEPPKFRINKKIPRGPPSPPAPVLHSPSRKVTVKEQKEWKIPPCISNWKNAKGYTIPLDKRLAADGRGLQQVHINEKFAKMAEALYIADRKAREAVEARAQLEKKLAQKEKEKKEDMLRMMAQRAREERAGLRNPETASDPIGGGANGVEARERNDLRAERQRERQRDRNLQRAAPEKRSKLQKERERDISEQIALGLPAKSAGNGETLFDQRLFNTTKGMDSGYGDDEAYNVYDKPWRDANTLGNHIYRPSKQADSDNYGGDLDAIVNTKRFVPDKQFSGASRETAGAVRSGPVEFEKEEDPFGLDQFLNMAKKAPKRAEEKSERNSQSERKRSRRD